MAFGRGETIGIAYVRVLADGKDFNLAKQLAGEIDDAGDMGDEAGAAYMRRFAERFKENEEVINNLHNTFKEGFAEMDVDAATLKRLEDEVATSVASSFDDGRIRYVRRADGRAGEQADRREVRPNRCHRPGHP